MPELKEKKVLSDEEKNIVRLKVWGIAMALSIMLIGLIACIRLNYTATG